MSGKVAFNALLLLGSDGGFRLLTFIANVYLARLLKTEGYGVVTLGLTVLSYAMWAADMGLATLGTREMAKPAADREFTAADIFPLRTLLGTAAVIVAGAVMLVAVGDPTTRIIIWLFLCALLPSFWQLEWYYQGARRYGAVAVIRYLFGLGYLAGVWFLVHSPDDIMRVPLIYLGALLLASGAALALRSRHDPLLPRRSPFGRPQLMRWRDALKRSTLIGFGASVIQAIQLLPPVIIAVMYDETEVGLFGAAFRLAVNLMIFDRAFLALFLPAISNVLAADPARSAHVLRRTFRVMLAGGILLSLAVTLLAEPIVALIYDREYAASAVPLAILSWYVGATLMSSFFSSVLIAAGVEKSFLRAGIRSSIAGGVLTIVLTWLFGIVGAAIGVAATEALMALLMYVAFRTHIGVPLIVRPRGDEVTNGSGSGTEK